MKNFVLPVLLLVLTSCSQLSSAPKTDRSAESAPRSPAATLASDRPTPLKVDSLTFDELPTRGCGMTLWQIDRTDRSQILFFNSLRPNEMYMKINGQLQRFHRTASAGQAFYGQYNAQTFISEDGNTTVEVDVKLGQPGESESVAIPKGMIRLTRDRQTISLPVTGDAGC